MISESMQGDKAAPRGKDLRRTYVYHRNSVSDVGPKASGLEPKKLGWLIKSADIGGPLSKRVELAHPWTSVPSA